MFTGHPLTTPVLPDVHISSSSEATSKQLSSQANNTCANESQEIQKISLSADSLSPHNNCNSSIASQRSSTILNKSSHLNLAVRPVSSYLNPITVLSSSDHSEKSTPGSPLKENALGPFLPQLSDRSSKRVTSDIDVAPAHEDFSSLSEQAWDEYLETKDLSENYSEDIDTEAEKKFLDMDDYRRYIDSDGGSSFFGHQRTRRHRGRGSYDCNGSASEWSIPSSRRKIPNGSISEANEKNSSCQGLTAQGPKPHKLSTVSNDKLDTCYPEDHTSDKNTLSDHSKSQSTFSDKNNEKYNEKLSDKLDKSIGGHSSDRSGRSSRKYRSPGGATAVRGGFDDSDSDNEDIVTLIEESKNHLMVAENVLSKHSNETAASQLMNYVSSRNLTKVAFVIAVEKYCYFSLMLRLK